MFFTGRSKQLPFFSEYLNRLVVEANERNRKFGLIGGIVGMIGGAMGAALGVLASIGRIEFSSTSLVATIVGINLAAWFAVMGFWLHDRRQRNNTPERRLQQEAHQVGQRMHQALHRRRLHRCLNAAAAELLEEAARHWQRVQTSLTGSFWSDPNLPGHWLSVREQAKNAAARGMEEMLVLLQSSFHEPSRQTFGEVVEEVLETFTGPKWNQDTTFPIGYDAAHQIANKMRQVADAFEQAGLQASRELGETSSSYGSERALDMALGELRVVQEAEDELRQNLRQGL